MINLHLNSDLDVILDLITIIIAESAFYVYIHCIPVCTFTKLISDNSTSYRLD